MKLAKLNALRGKKNLLAFSAGVDSSALFFALLEQNISFDLAIVNYQMRDQSEIEMQHAKKLAKKYGKNIFTLVCKLKSANFEHEARRVRYDFFEDLISKHGYENLLLAHQLDDRFEWLMMQMCKGAGVSELVGFKIKEKRKNYTLIRPLFNETRKEIKKYLQKNDLPYFLDESNEDEKYKRNEFRKICKPFMKKYSNGIAKSLEFLTLDGDFLDGKFYKIQDELFVYELKDELINMRLIDKAVKKLGFIMSEKTRVEALAKNAVINRTVAVGKNEKYGFIAPYCKEVMDKKFKEKCRIFKIPLHVRAYMFRQQIYPEKLFK